MAMCKRMVMKCLSVQYLSNDGSLSAFVCTLISQLSSSQSSQFSSRTRARPVARLSLRSEPGLVRLVRTRHGEIFLRKKFYNF